MMMTQWRNDDLVAPPNGMGSIMMDLTMNMLMVMTSNVSMEMNKTDLGVMQLVWNILTDIS